VKFSMSEAWRDATAMMTANREVLLIVAGIFFFIPGAAMAMAMANLEEAMVADPENVQAMMQSFLHDWWWLVIVYFVVTMVGTLAMLALLRDHSRPTVAEALRVGLSGLLPAIAASLVLGFGIGLAAMVVLTAAGVTGSPALVVLAILVLAVGLLYVYVKTSLTAPVIAIDKVYNPFRVIGRSWRLTKGNSLRIFLFYLLLMVVYVVVSLVLGLIGAVVLFAGPSAALLVNGILSGILGAISAVIFVAVIAAIHRQLSGPSPAAVSQTFE
jgi:hypothetical protein